MLSPEIIQNEVHPILQSKQRNFLLHFLQTSLSGVPFGQKGIGTEFYALREYQHGQDDPRLIDWKTSARMQKTHVREQQSEKGLNVNLILDSSGSMVQKKKHLCQIVYLFCKLLTESSLLDEGLNLFWGAAGLEGQLKLPLRRDIAREILEQIIEIPMVGCSNLKNLLISAQAIIKKRSLILLLTDLIEADWVSSLEALCKKHTVIVAHLNASIDHTLPAIGYSYLKDPENGKVLFVDCSDQDLQENYQKKSLIRFKKTYDHFYGINSKLKLWKIETDHPLKESIDELF
jgi:uncharacterized protein (DUF58 family)